MEPRGLLIPLLVDDRIAFRGWCATASAVQRAVVINLLSLQPLLRAEIQWALFAHTRQRNAPRWPLSAVQRLVELCRSREVISLFDLAPVAGGAPHLDGHADSRIRMFLLESVDGLRTVYYSPQDARDAGFIEPDHYGRRFPNARSCFDLSAVTQLWLRDMLWEHLHLVFEPTARAIAGLERALAGLDLLDQALAIDLRRPQDYFQRVWSTAFRAHELAALADAKIVDKPLGELV